MTRKHYIAIAKLLSTVEGDTDTIRTVAKELAKVLKEDNRAFDRDRFLTACGVQ